MIEKDEKMEYLERENEPCMKDAPKVRTWWGTHEEVRKGCIRWKRRGEEGGFVTGLLEQYAIGKIPIGFIGVQIL